MILYNLATTLYYWAIRLAAFLGHKKAQSFVELRKNQQITHSSKVHIWIHAASAGEGNQAIPIANQFKKICNAFVTISFYSPSGYYFHKNSEVFDQVLNLPIDQSKKCKNFINELQPTIAIFIKNELWLNTLGELKKNEIPAFLVNANPSDFFKQRFFNSLQYKGLRSFQLIYLSTQNKFKYKTEIPISNIIGDTKLESAFLNPKIEDDIIKQFSSKNKTIIIGSSWEQEENLVANYIASNKQIRIIIAPHEMDYKRINTIKNLFQNNIQLYSNYSNNIESQVLIIDKIGLLKSIYHYADVAIIGGGFGKGIHNILEAINFNLPVIIGPKFENFPEAIQLTKLGLVTAVSNQNEFNKTLDKLLKDNEHYSKISQQIDFFVANNKNVSNKIVAEIMQLLPNKFSI